VIKSGNIDITMKSIYCNSMEMFMTVVRFRGANIIIRKTACFIFFIQLLFFVQFASAYGSEKVSFSELSQMK